MKRKNIIFSIILTLLAGIYTYLVRVIDRKAIGPNKSVVGFAKVNKAVSNLIGSHMTIYKITEIIGLVVIAIVLVYGIIGLVQLIKRKSLKKVDRNIWLLGGLYVLMAIVYVVFEKVIINYRPILIDGELEASYPSSHTILALCVGISSIIVSKDYISDKYIKLTNILTILLLLAVFVGRIVSGVHWISDIVGGVLISAMLLMWFYAFYDIKFKKQRRKRH